MIFRWNKIAQLAAISACCSLAVWISSTSAKDEETSVLVKQPSAAPADGPVLPPPSNPSKNIAPQQKDAAPQHQMAKPAAKRPFMRPAEPRQPAHGKLTADGELPTPERPAAAPPATELSVRPAPPIKYETHHKARRMYRSGQVQLVMVAQDPADGCNYEIPLCVPACCDGAPTVSGGRGIFGRGVVEYCWSCGFQAKVKFRHVLGDVKVDYEVD